MDWTGRLIEANWNKTLLTYRFANGSYIEFFSAEQESKLRGARRNILYINEANNISFESYHQLAIRTSDEIWIDFNPTSQFWAHTELLRDEDSDHIILTYKDNEALSESIIKEIESAQEKGKTSSYWANWWKVYGLGEIGSLQGVVFDNWKQIDFVPKEAKLLGYGMDFGYTNDPTTLVAIYLMNNELYLDELIYTTNLNNNEIGNRLKALNITRPTEIVCDSAEPKSINELRLQGFNTQPAQKGPDSIRIGIDILKRYEMHVTQNSTNLIKELRAYQWDVDKEGKQTGKPVDHSNHAIDAIRYFALNKLNNRPRGKYVVLNV
jgi:phage terminase large subunit